MTKQDLNELTATERLTAIHRMIEAAKVEVKKQTGTMAKDSALIAEMKQITGSSDLSVNEAIYLKARNAVYASIN